jgi:hypothetical protein
MYRLRDRISTIWMSEKSRGMEWVRAKDGNVEKRGGASYVASVSPPEQRKSLCGVVGRLLHSIIVSLVATVLAVDGE